MKKFVVTFARGFGSGGKEIASALAHDLGIHCYENRILTLASQLSGLDEKLFNECLHRHLLITAIGGHIIRMVPPLIITEEDCDKAYEIIKASVEALG